MKAIVKCDVNFRSQPEKGENVIRILPKGHKVTIMEVDDKWMKVKASRKTGYVMTEYVEFIPEEIKEPEVEDVEETEAENTAEDTEENTAEDTEENTAEDTEAGEGNE